MVFYYIAINILTFVLFFIDKRAAKKNLWRKKESLLMGMILVGGVVGGFLGIFLLRHKSRKLKFKFVLVLSIILHILILYYKK